MSASKKKKTPSNNRYAHQEFGTSPEALQRAEVNLSPSEQDIRVQVSRKGRKGKSVTVISGFQMSAERLKALAKELKTQCGTGGTVKEKTIEIQGEHPEKLVEILTGWGYKAKQSGGS
ncbi:translation initiation factor [Geitlerinema sp. PCC 9228]|jgi:translation initiation factor 1|uniref:translation initiation factor n=1 Tax=Geitlerinema sp. PCC 9228 TaxID=111611 RepID=UPI0008F9A363|nr:translation initiation factor [Geitlerinema sp. PCC 9228]